jgi:hypothetical protein
MRNKMIMFVPLILFALIGVARADSLLEDDPVPLIEQLYRFITTGQGTLAIGAFSVLLVWVLRKVLSRYLKWFATAVGGYVLGFSVAGLQYFGTAVLANEPITMVLVMNAVLAAFAASGGWEALRDLLGSINRNAMKIATSAACFAVAISCSGTQGPNHVTNVVSCLGDRSDVDRYLKEFRPLTESGSVSWSSVYALAVGAGPRVGGCFLGELVAWYLRPREKTLLSLAIIDKDAAKATFEKFKAEYLPGKVLRTADGDL